MRGPFPLRRIAGGTRELARRGRGGEMLGKSIDQLRTKAGFAVAQGLNGDGGCVRLIHEVIVFDDQVQNPRSQPDRVIVQGRNTLIAPSQGG